MFAALAHIMNRYIVTIILITCASALSADEKVKFSTYESNLKVSEISYGSPYIEFHGEIEVQGTIVFRLDMLSETEFGQPIFADFIPDNNQLNLFPQIIDGRYPKKLERVSLLNTEEAYKQVYKVSTKHATREIRKPGTAILTTDATSIECDSRQYMAKLKAFTINHSVEVVSTKKVSGC